MTKNGEGVCGMNKFFDEKFMADLADPSAALRVTRECWGGIHMAVDKLWLGV